MGVATHMATMGAPKETIIGAAHGEQSFTQGDHWEVGAVTIGVKQHTVGATVLGCVWVLHH